MTLSLHWPSFHMPMVSRDWTIGSTGGGGISVGTPELKVAIDLNYLRLPMNHIAGGKVTKTYHLQGAGAGVGAGVGLSVPFVNASGSLDAFPGAGSKIWLAPNSKIHPDIADFCQFVYVASAQRTNAAMQGSAALVIFTKYQNLDPISITAAAVCVSTSIASSIVSLGADCVCYKVWLKDGGRWMV